ncbi:3504_t:CDS:1 [Paraglomus brasilianum]|uniref:3504_t:CDS:1 n=1 Tax=Paraglomus brasilianum TaxID=144538 RepID=A0A9N9F9J6_9GLOM|nr:3504_t:CDS:1 [Paraglomus brasilianum]
MQSIDSLRELLPSLGRRMLRFLNLKRRMLNLILRIRTEIPDLKRKFADIESEKVEHKARIVELLRQTLEESKRRDVENAELKARIEELEKNKTDSSAENELKAEVVKLRGSNEESKQPTQDISPKVVVSFMRFEVNYSLTEI